MLRITEKPGEKGQRVLLLEGKVCRQWLNELRSEIDKTIHEGKRLELDFSRVTFIDDEGARLLNLSNAEKVEKINCSPFIRSLLDIDTRGKN